jgi:hypothetical protein
VVGGSSGGKRQRRQKEMSRMPAFIKMPRGTGSRESQAKANTSWDYLIIAAARKTLGKNNRSSQREASGGPSFRNTGEIIDVGWLSE